MKKILSITAALLLAAGSMVFAQEAEEVKPEFKFSGSVYTGMSFNFNDSTVKLYNDTLGSTSRIDLNLSYKYGNVGAKGRLRFSPQGENINWAAESKTEKDDDGNDVIKTTLKRGLTTPYLAYGYVWADLFDGLVSTQAGYLTTTPLTTSFFYNDYAGKGISVQVMPFEGLTLAANAYVPGSKLSSDFSWKDYFNKGMNFGVNYSADKFYVTAAYGSAICNDGCDNSLWAEASVTPIDEVSATVEYDAYCVGADDFAWQLSGNVTSDPVDSLHLELFGTYGTYYYSIVDVEGLVSYTFNDKLSATLAGGFVLDPADTSLFGFGAKAVASYAVGKRSSLDLTYSFSQDTFADYAYNTTLPGSGNAVSVSYGLSF